MRLIVKYIVHLLVIDCKYLLNARYTQDQEIVIVYQLTIYN